MNLFGKSKIVIIAAILSLLNANVLKADTNLPPKVESYQPQVLLQKLIYEEDVNRLIKKGDWGQSSKPRQPKHWVVFSDRTHNTTYSSPSSSSTKFGELDFNEKVIIAKIENGYALVYTDPKNEAWPAYSQKAKSRGWIPMDNLLLWQSCPADTKGIYQKALLAANIESKANKDLGYCYSNPTLKSDATGMKTDMTFYYVMKTDSKSGLKLLANQSRLDGNSQKVLYGWVNENSFVPWNQRSCLEPNWNKDDVAYFNSPAGKPYNIYADPNLTEVGTSYVYGNPNKDDNAMSTKYRMNAYQTRFPILDMPDGNSNIYKCTTFGNAGRSIINPVKDNNSQAKQKLVKRLNQMKHINIIFVIDGTQSMKPYFASVEKAIEQGVKYFGDKFTTRVGVVIYRDYSDGQYLIEDIPLSKPNDPKLRSFLSTAGVYGAKSAPADRTNEEALFKGLEVATDPQKMGFTKDESTILIVIGDCGNDPNDTKCLTEDAIVDRLLKNNIQLLSCQVMRRPQLAWNLFNDQMTSIIKKNLTRQYKGIYPDVKARFKSLPIGYDFTSNTGTDFFIGSIRFAQQDGAVLAPGVLAGMIENNIGKFSEAVQLQLEAMISGSESKTGFVAGDSKNANESVNEAFLRSRLGDELYRQLKEANATVTFTGYAPKKDPQNRDYWKAVAFVSAEELETLVSRLADVYNNSNPNGDRKPYVDAVKALIRVMVPDITESDMDRMGIAEVMRLAQGLNEASDAVKGRSLTDIQDARIVNAAEYQTLINDFKEKYEYLRDKIKNNRKYKYSFETPNGQKFYWIPVEDLP